MCDDYITKLSIYKATKIGAPESTTRSFTKKTRKGPMRMTSNIEANSSDEEVSSLNLTKVPQKAKPNSNSNGKKVMLEDI